MRYFKKIVGEKVYLSPINVDDYEIYTKWLNDIEVVRGLGSYALQVNLFNERKMLEEMSNNGINFAIVEQNEDRILGNCSLMEVNAKDQTATLGIFIGEASDRGKGYGTEATKLIINYGFNYWNLENIMLTVFDFNKQAIRSYEKVGFKKFGERTNSYYLDGKKYNTVYMEILKSDWQAK